MYLGKICPQSTKLDDNIVKQMLLIEIVFCMAISLQQLILAYSLPVTDEH